MALLLKHLKNESIFWIFFKQDKKKRKKTLLSIYFDSNCSKKWLWHVFCFA